MNNQDIIQQTVEVERAARRFIEKRGKKRPPRNDCRFWTLHHGGTSVVAAGATAYEAWSLSALANTSSFGEVECTPLDTASTRYVVDLCFP